MRQSFSGDQTFFGHELLSERLTNFPGSYSRQGKISISGFAGNLERNNPYEKYTQHCKCLQENKYEGSAERFCLLAEQKLRGAAGLPRRNQTGVSWMERSY
jgi:hypothetical protein